MEALFDLFYQTSGVCTDTRNIQKDSLFIALKGAQFDGNDFVEQAIQDGAKFAITSNPKNTVNSAIFYVEDTLLFLQQLARYHRRKFPIPVIGITGSNGKTTSKELIAAVLAEKYRILFTHGNLNNHIGVPLTLLQLNETHELAIIEMGANKPGDIQELVEIAEPTHGIITNVGRAHLEGFGSLEGVIQTKTEMYRFLQSQNGLLIYNADDSVLGNHLTNYPNTFNYSGEGKGSVNGQLIRLSPFVEFQWNYQQYTSPVIPTQLVGKYNFYNFLAAVSFGVHFGVSEERINHALTQYKPTNNRSQVERTTRNTLILDAYNANPTSVQSALESFELIDHDQKVVILGDMLELGAESETEHQKIIDYLANKPWEIYLVGPLFCSLHPQFGTTCASSDELMNLLEQKHLSDKLILIKGSRGIKLERVVPCL